MVTLELTEQQAVILNQLIDIAVKTGGLNVAEAAVFFSNTIKSQLEPQQELDQEQESESVEDVVVKD